uniref:Uncharacterized protein n=1 Tax=Ditylenchus dipsaci TaxID=166011 RepID=A0A915DQD5_9BILA
MSCFGWAKPNLNDVSIAIENGRTTKEVFVTGLLVFVLIYICWKYVCRPKPMLPTASTANPSALVAVTCLPDVKVVKPAVTTQPPPMSGNLKQGPKPAPIPLPPVSKDLKQRQKPAPIPPLPVPVVEKDLPAVPSDKLLAIDDGDEVRLAPNTIEITSLVKKRRKNRRMLRAVDDDESLLRSRSLALRNKKRGQKAKGSTKNILIPCL